MLVTYANCQGSGVAAFLNNSLEFKQRFPSTINLINYEMIRDQSEIPVEILQDAKIFIYQPLAAKHGKYSTDPSVPNNILTNLSLSCIRISFPYIYSSAFSPIIPSSPADEPARDTRRKAIPINIDPIFELKQRGVALNTVLASYENCTLDFKYAERFENSLKVLREKERHTSVHISDYIEHNARHRRLFLAQNHPTSCIFVNCANQVYELLGISHRLNADDFLENALAIDSWPVSIYDKIYWKYEYILPIDPTAYQFWRKKITDSYLRDGWK